MRFINAVFFRSQNYSLRYYVGLESATVSLLRGIFGGIALYIVALILIPNFNTVGWAWWAYLIIFLLGVVWSHIFVIGLIILAPLQIFNLITPILTWVENAFLFLFAIFWLIATQIMDAISNRVDSE